MKFIDYLKTLILFFDSKDLKIEYVKPSLFIEMDELQRTADVFEYDVNELVQSFNKGELIELLKSDWKKLENTDSYYEIKNVEDVKKLAEKYDKDFDRVYNQITVDKKIEAPIILYRNNQKPYLIGGNTRLMVLRSLGIIPTIFAVRL